jgi:cellulose synthase (UDP-forming)
MMVASGVSYWDAIAPGLVMGLIAVGVLPWLDRNNTLARTVGIGVCLFLGWRYMFWRFTETMPPLSEPLDFSIGLVFTLVEMLSMLGTTLALFFLTRTKDRTPEANANVPWLKSLPKQPLVDVLVCTYNEEEAILERTIIGALGIDYPRYRLWVCDDGRRPWLKELCERHSCGYLTRPDNRHAKAGNINNALKHLAALPEQPEFVSILDADFVAKSQFLTRAVSLMRDPDVGVVQTPQHFFNPDPIQTNLNLVRVWPDEQRFFFDVVMASKDAWGGAFCCGTSSVLRFAPLVRIGGFPTDSVTEDYLASLRLKEIGYRTVYLNEALSLGLAPEGLKEYVSQRARWALGFMQICRGPSGPLSTKVNTGLLDRIMLTETFLHWSATHLFRILALIVPTLYLLFNVQVVYAGVPDAISYLLPFFIVQAAMIMWLTNGRVLPLMADLSQLLGATDITRSVFIGLFRPQGHKFQVTAKGGDRTKGFVQWRMLRIFLAYLALNVAGIIWAFMLDDTRSLADASIIAYVWTWYNIVILTMACFVCVEASQARRGDRFHSSGWAILIIGNTQRRMPIADISVSGMRLRGVAPAPVGTDVRLQFDGIDVAATIMRADAASFAIQFAPSQEMHASLVRHIYGGRYGGHVPDISAAKVAGAVLNRVFR